MIKILRPLLAAWLALAPAAVEASQATLVTPSAPLPMTSLAGFLNAALLSVGSCQKGPSAPTNGTGGVAFAGECWANDNTTTWPFAYYDGASWVTFGSLNSSTHAWTIDSVTISNATLSAGPNISQNVRMTGVITPTALSGAVNDYNPSGLATASVILQDGGAADRNITGLTAQAGGTEIAIFNVGTSNALVLKNQNASSSAANRFLFGGDIQIAPGQAAVLWYNATASRWLAKSTFTVSGGTPAGTLTSLATTYPICGGTITTSGTATYCGATSSGQLTFTSSTALKFAPYNGDTIRINGAVLQIPAAGITGCGTTSVFVDGTGAQNLVLSTLYYVYVFNNSGTLTCDYSTTSHATDSTAGNIGTEIKSAVSSRSLIGMVWTDASVHFADVATASWFNRRNKAAQVIQSGNSTTTAIVFVGWAEEAFKISTYLTGTDNTLNANVSLQNRIDGGAVGSTHTATVTVATGDITLSVNRSATASEGKHSFDASFTANAGTASYSGESWVEIRG